MNDLTLRTLFSGGELFGCGARAAGWKHVDGYELRGDIAAVAQLNGFDVHTANVCDVDYASLTPVDHLHGSPSCKTASQANTNGGETAEDLACADAICRAIRAHAGRSFSLENVWGYRNYESFQRILATLVACGFVYVFDHINAADFGVPQTRKRLWLRAVRRSWRERVPGLRPTHSKRGGLLLHRWRGWYGAVADIIETFPSTTPAPWQVKRMPKELRETILLSGAKTPNGDGVVMRHGDEPAVTVVAGGEQGNRLITRAFLLHPTDMRTMPIRDGDDPSFTVMSPATRDGHQSSWNPRAYIVSNGGEHGDLFRPEGEPAPVVTTQSDGRTRAFVVSGGSDGHRDVVPIRDGDEPMLTITTGTEQRARAYLLDGTHRTDGDLTMRSDDEPAHTIAASHARRPSNIACAYLFGDQSASAGEGVQIRAADEPAVTVRSGRGGGANRVFTAGRWVRFTTQGLGRLQTVPDDYKGLTSEINGNGIPSELAQIIMESLR